MTLRARLVEAAFWALARSGLARPGAPINAVPFTTGDAVAVIVPHPDDEMIGCHHLIAATGHEVAYDLFYVTRHENDARLTEIRFAESARASAGLTVRNRVFWNFPDGNLAACREVLRDRLDEITPQYDYILAPAPNDRTPDHIPIAEETLAASGRDRLVWYRSTWWTFSLLEADFAVVGPAEDKRAALACFASQGHLPLGNVVTLSAWEARRGGISAESIEAFQKATTDRLSREPLNTLSIRTFAWLQRWP